MYMYTVHAKSWQYICTTVKLVTYATYISTLECRSPEQLYMYIHIHDLMRDEKECTGIQVYIYIHVYLRISALERLRTNTHNDMELCHPNACIIIHIFTCEALAY